MLGHSDAARSMKNNPLSSGSLTLHSPAKVNLTLDVLGKESSGYHRIQTILHEVPELYDTLTFSLLKTPHIELHGNREDIPWDATNTIHRAATHLLTEYAPEQGLRIEVRKTIPAASGLGGAASNAATTIKALHQLLGLKLSREQLLTHAAAIGMDVPFFMLGGCALGMHYGEQLMPLPTVQTVPGYENVTIEIVNVGPPTLTANAYAELDLARCGQRSRDTGTLVKILKGETQGSIEPLLHNDFERGSPFRAAGEGHLSGSGGARFRLNRA